tara:strand:+ start:384 stop:1541 length:1158 start_codon:yes stop_codon:yes gene_type:complete
MGVFKSIKSLFLGEKSPEEKKENNIDKTKSDGKDLEFKIKSKSKTSIKNNLKQEFLKKKSEAETEPDKELELESKLDPDAKTTSTLDKGLEKTKKSFFSKLSKLFVGRDKVDIDVLDELEEVLISSDVGVETTIEIINNIETRVSKEKYVGKSQLNNILKEEISKIVVNENSNLNFNKSSVYSPYVIMVVGVNGAGKTTTIGKLAYAYKNQGKKVMLGASDTFRAAAINQLQVWADRVGVKLIKQQMGSDPASVAFDTLKAAKSQNVDIVIIDTAGRLHNKINLMKELSKIKRVMDKIIPESPHEVILVLDGSTGQNAFEQAKQFSSATDVNSLAITKLDGTAKGGVVLGISHQFKIPVKYIGIGEKIDDLKLFDPKSFVESFFR